jgi:hypothetical protein
VTTTTASSATTGAIARCRADRCTVGAARCAALVVIRSSTTASTTMASPASKAAPTFTRSSACTMVWPSPGASISAVITTIDSAIMIAWLTASTMVGRASGRRTLPSSCQRVEPSAVAASTVDLFTSLMPSAVIRMAGGMA